MTRFRRSRIAVAAAAVAATAVTTAWVVPSAFADETIALVQEGHYELTAPSTLTSTSGAESYRLFVLTGAASAGGTFTAQVSGGADLTVDLAGRDSAIVVAEGSDVPEVAGYEGAGGWALDYAEASYRPQLPSQPGTLGLIRFKSVRPFVRSLNFQAGPVSVRYTPTAGGALPVFLWWGAGAAAVRATGDDALPAALVDEAAGGEVCHQWDLDQGGEYFVAMPNPDVTFVEQQRAFEVHVDAKAC